MIVSVGLVALALPEQLQAATQDSPAARALRKAQGMLRQLNAEKQALAAEKTKLEEKLKEVEKENAQLKDKVQKRQKQIGRYQDRNNKLMERISQDRTRMEEMVARYREKVRELKRYQADNQLLRQAVLERNHWIDHCRKQNQTLLQEARKILQAYRDKDVWEALLESEPVTGIPRVELENQVQAYRFRLQDLTVKPFKGDKQNPGNPSSPDR